jgi:hypothetical protein
VPALPLPPQVKVDYSVSPPKVTAVSGDGLPVMMPVKDAIRSCQGGAVYLVDILLLPCPFTDTTFTGGCLAAVAAGCVRCCLGCTLCLVSSGCCPATARTHPSWVNGQVLHAAAAVVA